MSNHSNHPHPYPSPFLNLLHPSCLQGYHGNLSSPNTHPPQADASREEGQEKEDTDFGAVMYISAVLIFYSLGIVVMIVKYLRTERKEIEEELMVENFVKGIPSKKMEHEQEAVNRVAIRAFHTLTSRAPRQEQVTCGLESSPEEAEDGDPTSEGDGDSGDSPDDSDCVKEESSFRLLRHHRSKHLPRVSLMFRQSRSSHRSRPQYGMRNKTSSFKSDKERSVDHHSCPPNSSNKTDESELAGHFGEKNNLCGHKEESKWSPTDEDPAVKTNLRHAYCQTHCEEFLSENTRQGSGVRFEDGENRSQQSRDGIRSGTCPQASANSRRETSLMSASRNTRLDRGKEISKNVASKGNTDGEAVHSKITVPEAETDKDMMDFQTATNERDIHRVYECEGGILAPLTGPVCRQSVTCDRDGDVDHSTSSTVVMIDYAFGPKHVLESDV